MMTISKRVLTARFLIPLFFVWSVMVPYREARAFVAPPGVIPPPAFVATAGSSPVAVGIGALAVGTVVGYLLVGAVFGDNSTDAVRLQLATPTNAVPPAPNVPATATGTGGMSAEDAAMPKAQLCSDNVPISTTWGCGSTFYTLSYCQSWIASHVPSPTYNIGCKIFDANQTWNGSVYYHQGAGGAPVPYPGATTFGSIDATCPVGYSGIGGICNLANARLVQADKAQDALLTGTGSARAFTVPADVDTPTTIDGSKIVPIIRGNGSYTKTAYVYGHDSSGRQVLVEVAVASDGSQTYVRHYIQDDSTGQSQIQKTTATIDAATGTVTSVQKDVQVGTISSPAANTLTQTSTANPTATTAPQVTTSTTTPVSNSAQQQQIVFPSDYARTGEAATAAQTITPKLDTIHHDLTDQATAPTDPAVPDKTVFEDAYFKDTFAGLLSWSIPAHSSQCPTATFDYVLFGHANHLVMDAHCTIAEQIRPVLNVSAVVMWTLVALFIVLGA